MTCKEFDRIAPALEPVELPRDAVLEEPHEEISHVYFPTTGVACFRRQRAEQGVAPRLDVIFRGYGGTIVAVGMDGESVDTTMIGREGMTGLAVFLGTGQMPVRTMVQVSLSGVRLPSGALHAELERQGRLVNLLHRYTQVVMVSMAQLILCNRMHRLDQRAARWLLQVDERVDEAPFDVTQEFLAEMIGTQRPSVSLAVRQFKDDGLVRYSRGRIVISDREGLLKRSCACITIMHEEERRLRETGEHYGIGSRSRQ